MVLCKTPSRLRVFVRFLATDVYTQDVSYKKYELKIFMFFQPFNVIAWLHAGKANVPYKAPSLKAVERDSVPCLTIDYEEAEGTTTRLSRNCLGLPHSSNLIDKTAPAEVASAAFYPCAKIIPQDQDGILLCAPEIQRLVDLALKGWLYLLEMQRSTYVY